MLLEYFLFIVKLIIFNFGGANPKSSKAKACNYVTFCVGFIMSEKMYMVSYEKESYKRI